MKAKVNAGLNWAPEISNANIVMIQRPSKITYDALEADMKTIIKIAVPISSISKRIMLNLTI